MSAFTARVTAATAGRLSATACLPSACTTPVHAPSLPYPSPFTFTSTHRLNYDEAPQSSTTETFESANPGWTVSGNAVTMPNIVPWQLRTLSAIDHVFFGPDNNGQIDGVKASLPDEQILTSPTFQVGTGPLVIGFRHRFSFESGNWDGGVVEITTNNGGSWTKIGTYTGVTNPGTNAPIGANTPAFVGRIAGWPNFTTVSFNLGTAYANQNAQIRFRTGSDDSTGAPGWDIDDVTLSGVTTTPFTALVPETGTCQ